MIAQRLAIAVIVATWSVPTIVVAQHAKAEPTAAHAAAKSEGKDKHTVASTASARSKTAPKNELAAALERIDEQMATMRTSPAAAQSGKPRAANETRPARVSPPPAPSVTRISLSWRTTLVWEQELDGGTDAAQDAPHVGLVWPIEPLESTPIAPTSAR